MKIMLLNDTGIVPHVGCQAVSDAHVRMLAKLGHSVKQRYFVDQLNHYNCNNEHDSINKVLSDSNFVQDIEAVDAVIVNGEGTIHHGAGLHYLAILAVAQKLGKKTLIVNAAFQECYGYENVLRKLDDFCVRDALSSEFATKRGINNRIVIDSFVEAGFNYSDKPFIDLTRKIVITDWHHERNIDTGETIKSYFAENQDKCFFLPLLHGIHHYMWRLAPQSIAKCDFIITGRHHGIYLAAIARKPFVALPSNTHKIEGLIKMSGIPIPICSTVSELKSGIEFCKNTNAFNEFFEFIAKNKPLSTFAALGNSNENVNLKYELEKLENDIKLHCSWQSPYWWSLLPTKFGQV